MLKSSLGYTQGYEVKYNGPCKHCRVMVETWSNDERLECSTLAGFGVQSGGDMTIGFVAIDPRREGDVTELSCVVKMGGLMFTRHELLSAWDGLQKAKAGTTYSTLPKSAHVNAVAGEPFVLWRWTHHESVPQGYLPEPMLKDATVLQVTLEMVE